MKKGFILYKDNYEPIQNLSQEEKGELLDAIFDYNIDGKVGKLSPAVKMAFGFLRPQFDRDIEKYQRICDKNKENIARRWSKENTKNTTGKSGKKRTTVYDRIRPDTKNTHSHTDTDTDTDSHRDSDTDTKELPPFATATAPSTPQADFVLAWGQLYESETQEKFKADRKDFILVANLLKKYSYDDLIKKAKLLFMACKTKNLWFTKGGIADFNIGKLSSKWNELIESNAGGNHGGSSKYEQTVSAARAFAQENGIG